ncbi:MAG: UDP-N-acetylmuramoyl-tripeptide--D-alanyl-D-alanine ligase [Chlamydiia bacterium]|nr:UDP-N-acetylmuramoyl-tripeptide--D-alanyl-D-alanine ligase [Chlamydiia bacterium]
MYKRQSVNRVAKRLNQVAEDERVLSDVAVDSRKCSENALFIATRGDRVDGHSFLKNAKEKGAIAAVVSKDYSGEDFGLSLIKVDDPLLAMQDLAMGMIKDYSPFVVAITGSVGKTTTKEFLYTLVKERYNVSKTISSYNGQIGLPLSILNADEDAEMLILEMGISHPFEMDTLIEIAPPQIAILGRVAEAHLGHFDSLEHLASEKAKIFNSKHLRMGFVHESNMKFSCIKENHIFKKYTYGSVNSDYYLSAKEQHVDLTDKVKEEKISFTLPFSETHFQENFLASAIVASYLNMPWSSIRKRAQLLKPFKHRFEKKMIEDVLYIDDTYNCNPLNLEVGLKNIPKRGANSKVFAVVGEMRELGENSKRAHESLGEIALDYVDELFCFGEESYPLYQVFHAKNSSAIHTLEKSAIYQVLKDKVSPGDVVYLKGGNANKLWEILDMLMEKV